MNFNGITCDIAYGPQIAAASGILLNPNFDTCIARLTPEGKLMGGVIYSQYTGAGGSVTMHVAGFLPRWVNRGMLWTCFDYPFNQLDVRVIFGQVPTSNAAALMFDLHLGFRLIHVIRDVYPNDDMNLLAMYRPDCRFIEGSIPRI